MKSRFVFDTNALVSAVLSPYSTNALALREAEKLGKIVYSPMTWSEFAEVLLRPKFDRYFSVEVRETIIQVFQHRFIEVFPTTSFSISRDPKGNMFLDLAVAANANCIITGDPDLLVLHPFRGIPVLKAAEFLKQF